jgi:hypothetical protein
MVTTMPEGVDCIVRLHDAKRITELDRCIFSLASQDEQPVRILLVTQRFSQKEQDEVLAALQPLLRTSPQCELELLNYESPSPVDARTGLLNLGLSHCQNRYVGFLDYDDVLYPEAYRLLKKALHSNNAAIAFAGIRVIDVDLHDQWIYGKSVRRAHFSGQGLIDLFQSNFCPIHSYLIDRHKISDQDLRFDEELTIEEDYDLLLRLCAQYKSNFDLLSSQVGDYIFKSDGSNTIHAAGPNQQSFNYAWVMAQLEVTKSTTTVSPAILEELGIASPQRSLTIRQLLDQIEISRPLDLPPVPAGT